MYCLFFHRFFRGLHGVLLVCSIDDKRTFDHLQDWLGHAKRYIDPNVVVMLVGNKWNQEGSREVTTKEALGFANRNAMSFYETSAKESIVVDVAFTNILKGVCVCACMRACVHACMHL